MAKFSSMVDLAKTAPEVKEDIRDMSPGLPAKAVPAYPYGLCLCLDEETLEKLGIDGDLPDVGDSIQFTALARVTSASANECMTETGEREIRQRIELQITAMDVGGIEEEEDPGARRKRFYGDASEIDAGYDDED